MRVGVLGGTFDPVHLGHLILAEEARNALDLGLVLFIPAGAVHAVRNIGGGPASELATYVVEKGQPLVTLMP